MLRQYRLAKKRLRGIKNILVDKYPLLQKAAFIRKRALNIRFRLFGTVDEKLVVFKSNYGLDCSGMPSQIYQYMLTAKEYEDYKFAWLFTDKKQFNSFRDNKNTRIYSDASKKALRVLTKAHYVVCDTELKEYEKLRSRQILVFDPEEHYGNALDGMDEDMFGQGEYKLKNALRAADFILVKTPAHREFLSLLCKRFGNFDLTMTDKSLTLHLPELFINPAIGSADGPIKKFIRKYPTLFALLKSLNRGAYRAKGLKKKLTMGLKDMIKAIDLKMLKIHYTFTGFFRGAGWTLGENARELHSYKNRYRGQKCFLIGNGPSLTAGDLELLKDEITFGCNRVYQMYDSTSWRPTYYCMIDALIAKYSSMELAEHVDCPLFTNINTRDLMTFRPGHLIFARNLGEKNYRVSPRFESYYVPSGATVMTFMLELAMYMGFSEIYLLGVDCTSSLSAAGHCSKGYVNQELIYKDIERIRKRLNDPSLTAEQVAAYYFDQSTYSYTIIRDYARSHGFQIYNATRGGMLEVFERKNLDEVVKYEKTVLSPEG